MANSLENYLVHYWIKTLYINKNIQKVSTQNSITLHYEYLPCYWFWNYVTIPTQRCNLIMCLKNDYNIWKTDIVWWCKAAVRTVGFLYRYQYSEQIETLSHERSKGSAEQGEKVIFMMCISILSGLCMLWKWNSQPSVILKPL